jgi:hypothetical protein
MAWAVVINHGLDMFACKHASLIGQALIGGGQAVQVFVETVGKAGGFPARILAPDRSWC